MLALVCANPPRLVRDRAEPVRAAGETLLQMRMAGVCDTDLQLARGYMGYAGVLGHEFVADVIESDDASLLGQRVVGDINASCGKCPDCTLGDGHHCSQRTVLGILARDGALAERFVLPTRNLVSVPGSVSDERAVFAEPLAAALHVLQDLPADGPCVVLGDGKLGLLIARAVASSGRRVMVVGHHGAKLALAGCETVLEQDVGSSLENVPAIIEATGSASGLRWLRPRGTLILKTTIAGASDVDLSPIVINELRVIGSRCGHMQHAISALQAGFDPCALIAARYPLSEAERAIEHAATRGTLKVLVSSSG